MSAFCGTKVISSEKHHLMKLWFSRIHYVVSSDNTADSKLMWWHWIWLSFSFKLSESQLLFWCTGKQSKTQSQDMQNAEGENERLNVPGLWAQFLWFLHDVGRQGCVAVLPNTGEISWHSAAFPCMFLVRWVEKQLFSLFFLSHQGAWGWKCTPWHLCFHRKYISLQFKGRHVIWS